MMKVEVAASADVQEGRSVIVEAAGRKILLIRVNGQVQAVENKCSHMGLNMAKGKIVDGVLQCPWHGAKFDVRTGANLEWVQNFPGGIQAPKIMRKMIAMGKSPAPLAHFPSSEHEGKVYLELDH